MSKILKAIRILFLKGPFAVINKVRERHQATNLLMLTNKKYRVWFDRYYPKEIDLLNQKKLIKKFKYLPKMSIITPTYNTPERFLKECIESVLSQTYSNWELCIIDDASTDKKAVDILKQYSGKDKRMKVVYRKKNGNVSAASNDALEMATGDFVAFLDHDDVLWPNALYEVVKLINEKPNTQFIYSDEDKLDEDGKTHVDPFFKPDWSPDYLRSINYITHFTVIKKSLMDKIGNFKVGYEGTQDWDLYLRTTRELENKYNCHPLNPDSPIQHIPTILYSWRKSSTSTSSEKYAANKYYAYENQRKVLGDDLTARKCKGEIIPSEYLGLWQIKYKMKSEPLVSIIIPTKDHFDLISKCLYSILDKTTYGNFELIIIDTGSTDKNVWSLYEDISKKHESTRLLKWIKPFNFSKVCNCASDKSSGEYLVFLNNDTEILNGDWLEIMLGYAQLSHIGSVGIKLVYPNNRIQHTGIIFDPKNKLDGMILPDHAFKNFKDGLDYKLMNSSIYGVRDYLAVTAACMMIKKKIFRQVNGFDERYQIAFNDVDLGIKLNTFGLYNVSINWLKMLHHESASVTRPGDLTRDTTLFKQEQAMLYKSWNKIISHDPFLGKTY